MKTNKSLKKAEELNNSMNGILAIAEGYPEVKASEQFLNLQKNLSKIESQLQAARRIYNNDVTKYNTKIEAWAPLGHALTNIFNEEIIKKLAEKYKKTPAQIILRWNIQRGIITIPKSQKPERIKENFEIFDFEMTEDEIKEIDALDGKQKRIQDDEDVLEKQLLAAPAPADE